MMDVVKSGNPDPARNIRHINREPPDVNGKPLSGICVVGEAKALEKLGEGGFDGDIVVVEFHGHRFYAKGNRGDEALIILEAAFWAMLLKYIYSLQGLWANFYIIIKVVNDFGLLFLGPLKSKCYQNALF